MKRIEFFIERILSVRQDFLLECGIFVVVLNELREKKKFIFNLKKNRILRFGLFI